jgi:hypothetical protein
MSIEMKDRTGEPRTVEELEQALRVVNETLRDPASITSIPPLLFMELMTIRHGLQEVIALRRIIAKKMKEKQ